MNETNQRRRLPSCALNARNRSTKSWFIGELTAQTPLFLAQPPDFQDALVGRNRRPIGGVVPFLFRVTPKHPDLHPRPSIG